MSLNKDQLIFDPSGSDEDSVGAYLRSSDGTLLTHTTSGGKEALDVNIAASDLADFDIRDLTHVSDSVKIGDGTDFLAIAADGSIAITDNGGSLTVDAVDLDVRDMTHVSDSMKIGDGTDFLAVETDGSINVNTTDSGFSSCANPAAAAPTTTATQLVASALSSRDSVIFQNTGSAVVYIGCDNTVTAAKGIKLPKGASIELAYDDTVDFYGITASGTGEIRVLEGAA